MRAEGLRVALVSVLWMSIATGAGSVFGAGPAPAAPTFPFGGDAARHYQQAYADWAGLPREFTNRVGMTFVLIPPGTFVMGSPDDEPGRQGGGFAETPHSVTLTHAIYISRYETTVAQFRTFVEAEKYVTDAEVQGGGHAHDAKAEWKHRPGTSWRRPGFAGPYELRDEHPVVHVSHTDSLAFCRWLAKQAPAKLPRPMAYDLPTEAQWEWACRAGSAARYWWGSDDDTSGAVANVGDRSLKRIHPDWPRVVMPMDDGQAFVAPVGKYRANAFGLHDMLGNVWEFCATRSGPYPREKSVDPLDLDPQRGFAVRGGGWSNIPADVRCATRNADPPHFSHSNLGFRVALVPPESRWPSPDEVLTGLRRFYQKTARPDGSFQPGVDPHYLGMSDSAYSDLAAVTYAVTMHRTFGWQLPNEARTVGLLLSRQKPSGEFVSVSGTVDPASPEGRTYNTTQGLVALRALGVKPRFNPLAVFEDILKEDFKTLPPYSTSFFPLAYLCAGQPIPEKADRGIRALMVQDETGYLNDHVAATFHASHYYRLVGEETPKSQEMVARILRDQKLDGSWLLNHPSRDRHATFDAVFTLRHEGLQPDGRDREDCRAAIQRAAAWALSCRNADGGFGHFPGSTSDADAVYFQVGTLVMAGFLKPADPLPSDPHLLSWGHLMPVAKSVGAAHSSLKLPGWVAAVAFSLDGRRLAVGSADKVAQVFDAQTSRNLVTLKGHADSVASVCFHPEGKLLATGSYDHNAAIWQADSAKRVHLLTGHRGAVLSVAFSPDGMALATASVDGTIKLWDVASGRLQSTLAGHKSWVSSIAFSPDGKWLASGSSDGTVAIWSRAGSEAIRTLRATSAEVRSVAVSPDGKHVAAGTRYGPIKVWDTSDWKERFTLQGQANDVWSVAFSHDGQTLAASEGDWNRAGFVKLWSMATGQPLRRLQHTGEVLAITFSPDGHWLAAGAGDHTVKVWALTESLKKD